MLQQVSGTTFRQADLELAELFVLQQLRWDLCVVTPGELMRALLYFAAPDYDFADIIEKAATFVTYCLLDSELARSGPEPIAVGSVLFALSQFGLHDFRADWLRLMSSEFDVNMHEALKCQVKVEAIIIQYT